MGQILCFGKRDKSYTINNVVFKKEGYIAEGAYSFVYSVSNKEEKYALKVIPLLNSEIETIAKTEVYTCKLFRDNTAICHLIDHEMITNDRGMSTALLLLKYYNGPNLSILSGKLDNELLADYFQQMLEAVRVLHCYKGGAILHNDIKESNFMLTSDDGGRTFRVVLIDLGSCKSVPILVKSRQMAAQLEERFQMESTCFYRAPELFNVPSTCVLGLKSDIWSLGCTLYAMAYGTSPFNGSALSAHSSKILFPKNDTRQIDTFIKDMIISMCNVDPNERPSIMEIIHKFSAL